MLASTLALATLTCGFFAVQTSRWREGDKSAFVGFVEFVSVLSTISMLVWMWTQWRWYWAVIAFLAVSFTVAAALAILRWRFEWLGKLGPAAATITIVAATATWSLSR